MKQKRELKVGERVRLRRGKVKPDLSLKYGVVKKIVYNAYDSNAAGYHIIMDGTNQVVLCKRDEINEQYTDDVDRIKNKIKNSLYDRLGDAVVDLKILIEYVGECNDEIIELKKIAEDY